ncbi:MAG: DUF4286 family protein [Bacteroidota bacterium]
MILYNVTVSVDESIHDEWLKWIKEKHIPDVMATKRFENWKLYRVLLEKDNAITYSVQYFAKNMAELQLYQALDANRLQADHQEKFSDKAVAFRTVLEEV